MAADIVRINNGMLAERCAVQVETTLPGLARSNRDISLRTFRGRRRPLIPASVQRLSSVIHVSRWLASHDP
ncbi:hypothetical protein SF83666_c37870 [Sinorhizobium fredii CCBAU 83666]|nr:hypothetical protein SF83666_c37870 [Sinorhizobium fredii CCBAU 83666]